MFEPCPCGSGATYLACCAPLHLGQAEAETPEALMRARYSAFARRDAAFLLKSWSAEHRPQALEGLDEQVWLGLTVEAAEMTGAEAGTVAFSARYRPAHQPDAPPQTLRETSRFRRENGVWVYVDGAAATRAPQPARKAAAKRGKHRPR